MRRYLVIGRAKTGTTGISKTIHNTTGIQGYYLEPKVVSFFESIGNRPDDAVVKILFDHWDSRTRLLNAIVHNELGTNFSTNLFITRDPRAELVSRLLYVAFPYFQNEARPKSDIEKWTTIFRRKEDNPDTVSLREMSEYLATNFATFSEQNIRQVGGDAMNYAAYLSQLPESVKTMIRYEDFAADNLADHPCRDILSGNRDVGDKLTHTRRTNGADDWSSFILDSDIEWIDSLVGPTVDALGYDRHSIPERRPIRPEHCSEYIARIIEEARSTLPPPA